MAWRRGHARLVSDLFARVGLGRSNTVTRRSMKIRAGYDIAFTVPQPTPIILMLGFISQFCGSRSALISRVAVTSADMNSLISWDPDSVSGPGPVINSVRKADGTLVVQDPCCTLVQRWLGDHTIRVDAVAISWWLHRPVLRS